MPFTPGSRRPDADTGFGSLFLREELGVPSLFAKATAGWATALLGAGGHLCPVTSGLRTQGHEMPDPPWPRFPSVQGL